MSIDSTENLTTTIPDGLQVVPGNVRDLARGIAENIRSRGHWQGGLQCSDGGVCIITSPAYAAALRADFPAIKGLWHLIVPGSTPGTPPLPDWNDTTPTADVLARLDAIAEGLAA